MLLALRMLVCVQQNVNGYEARVVVQDHVGPDHLDPQVVLHLLPY